MQEHLQEQDIAVILPVYLYDHSGITLSTAPFNDTFDSCQVGYIYITKEKARKEYSVKRISKKLKNRIKSYLEGEIKAFDQYLTGDIYGFELIDSITGEEYESCWGFYGNDYETNGILDSIWHAEYEIVQVDNE